MQGGGGVNGNAPDKDMKDNGGHISTTHDEPMKTPPTETLEFTPPSVVTDQIKVVNLDEIMKYEEKEKNNPPIIHAPSLSKRSVLNQEEFDKRYGYKRLNFSLARHVLNHFQKMRRYKTRDWITVLHNRVPIVSWLPHYSWKRDLFADILGGLMVSIMCVPQGLAYGFLVGVPPIYGLYTSIVGPLIYAVFGTSRHTSPGSFAIVSLMIGTIVQEIGEENSEPDRAFITNGILNGSGGAGDLCCKTASTQIPPEVAIEVATSITFFVGIWQIIFGLLNAGLLAVWLSDHLVQGLTSGAALHVLSSQMRAMTGVVSVPASSESSTWGLAKFFLCLFASVNEMRPQVAICSLICIILLLFSSYVIDPVLRKWMKAKFPMEFVLVVTFTLITFLSYGTEYDIKVPHVGKVQQGMVAPQFPQVRGASQYIGKTVTIAIISFVIHIALAKLISKKFNYAINPNQEWFALGVMHTVSSAFGCFAGGSSLGRSMTHVKFATRSQLSTIVCVIVIVLVVFIAAPYIEFLPKSVLAVIVVMAMKDLLLQIKNAFSLFHQSTPDFLIWLVTFMAVTVHSLMAGLIVGVAFALLSIIFRSQWAESTLMGRIPGTCDFKGLDHYKLAEEINGIIVFRFDAPLYFANAETFIERIHEVTRLNPVFVRMKVAEQKELEHGAARKAEKSRNRNKNGCCGVKRRKLKDTLLSEEHTDRIQLLVKNKKVEVNDKHKESPDEANKFSSDDTVQLTHIVIDCSSIHYIDMMGKEALYNVYKDYAAIQISVLFANCKVYVRQFFELSNFHKEVPKNRLFVSVSDAVAQAQREKREAFQLLSRMALIDGPKLPVAKSPTKGQSECERVGVVKSLADTQPLENDKETKKDGNGTSVH